METDKSKPLNKNVFLWALYNFANTPITIAMGGLFLAQWVVLDNKFDDIWYGATFTLATIVLLITSPFLGAWSDKVGKRMPFLRWTTYIQAIVGLLLGIIAVSGIATIPKVIIVLVLFFCLQYFYQISLVFYNTIFDLLSTSFNRGRVSGITETADNIGWLLGPALLLPFSMGYITLFGSPGRAQVFLPAVIIFIVTGFPMILWFKEPKIKNVSPKIDFKGVYKDTIDGFKMLIRKEKNITRFLVSFMFVSDALLTASLYFAIFLDRVFKISDIQKYIALGLLEITAVLSAYLAGKIADKVGIKKVLMFSCINLTLVYGLMSVTSSLSVTYILSAFVGFGYGGFYTTSRALLVKLSPASRLGEYFGFYSTFQKFASIIGPLTWGAIIFFLKDLGVMRYRLGILSLSLLMLIGTLLMVRVKEKSGVKRDILV
jgi:MFS transporter, UMF1 family